MKITEGLRGAVQRVDDCIWEIPAQAKPGMRVPGRVFADERLAAAPSMAHSPTALLQATGPTSMRLT